MTRASIVLENFLAGFATLIAISMPAATSWLIINPMPSVETFLILTGPKSSRTGDAKSHVVGGWTGNRLRQLAWEQRWRG